MNAIKRVTAALLPAVLIAAAAFRVSAAGAASEVPPGSLLARAPRQAVLLVYGPSVERAVAAWDLLAPVRQSKDFAMGFASKQLRRIDEEFLNGWGEQLGVTVEDVRRALPGEALIGWLPRPAARDTAFDADGWVLVARRSADRDAIIRELWQRVAAKAGKDARVERRTLGPIAVEQVLWEVNRPAQLAPPRRTRVPGRPGEPPPARIAADTFEEISRVERHGISLGLSEEYVFFAPARAEALEPWVRAVIEGQGAAAAAGDRARALLAEAGGSGDPILILRATPPAWVPAAESAGERRLGGHPMRVLLSQTRSLEAVMTQSGNRVFVDGRATVLPPPGWIARLLAALAEGAMFSAESQCRGEVTVRADFAELWKAARSVLMEGWPTVGLAIDLFLAPLGGERSEGIGQLTATLGSAATLFIFRAGADENTDRSWACAVELKDPARFARFESRIEMLVGMFAHVPVHYTVAPDGRLQTRAHTRATTAPASAPQLHLAVWGSHFALAGSPAALQNAVGAVAAQAPVAPASFVHPAAYVLLPASVGRRPSILFYEEVLPGKEGELTFGGRTRRTIRGGGATFELDSPPREGAGGPAGPPSGAAVAPIARVSAALTVESESTVRVRLGIERLTSQPAESRPPAPTAPRRVIMQE